MNTGKYKHILDQIDGDEDLLEAVKRHLARKNEIKNNELLESTKALRDSLEEEIEKFRFTAHGNELYAQFKALDLMCWRINAGGDPKKARPKTYIYDRDEFDTTDLKWEPVKVSDDNMAIEHWLSSVTAGELIDYDGFGEYATAFEKSGMHVYPSDVCRRNPDGSYEIIREMVKTGFTHIVWYNR